MTSTLSAEHTIVGTRARLIMLVFSFIGLGSLAAGIVFVVLLAAFKSGIEADIDKVEYVWRLLLGLGIIPVACTLYARLRMKETAPYKKCKPPSYIMTKI
jgi:MFS transporter, PHS family, inorganic phosphate transporter